MLNKYCFSLFISDSIETKALIDSYLLIILSSINDISFIVSSFGKKPWPFSFI